MYIHSLTHSLTPPATLYCVTLGPNTLNIKHIFLIPHLILVNICRHDAPLAICKVQDYTFQLGQMLTTVTITAINAYVFNVLYTKALPKDKTFTRIFWAMVAFSTTLVGICVAFNIASLFCDNEYDSSFDSSDFGHGSKAQRIVLKVSYFYPLVCLLCVNMIFCFYCVFQFVFNVKENKFMLPLLKRLLTFTLIVIVSGTPKLVSIFLVPGSHIFSNISDCVMHMSGVLLSISYFYYAIVQDKRRWDTRTLLRATLLMSHTPGESSSWQEESKCSVMMSSAAIKSERMQDSTSLPHQNESDINSSDL
jgi:hypothetical protein